MKRSMALGAVLLTAACTDNTATTSAGGDDRSIDVSSTSDACTLSSAKAPSGTISFNVKNDGDRVTEFYLLTADGSRILGEVENIGPGVTRKLVVTVGAGSYLGSCKPGMAGDGIRTELTVTDSGEPLARTGATQALAEQAVTEYRAYVHEEVEELVEKTAQFAAAFESGNAELARSSYASTRMHWERIEPVAESWSDLDQKLDIREADLEPNQQWTGWHRAEKDLWPPAGYTPMTAAERSALAKQVVADTADLDSRLDTLELTLAQMTNGAKELIDEVASTKVTGEEETWSHTDMWDFQANIDGVRRIFEAVKAIVVTNDPQLAEQVEKRLADLQVILDQHKVGEGFVSYTQLNADQVKALSDAVAACGEPVSKLTETVLR